MAAKDFIVAIEIGSSKMTGIAGKKDLDGSISVLAVVKEDSSSFIRKGVIYNINQTVQCISNIIKKLSATLKAEIVKVYVGVGGQSIRSIKNVIVKDLPEGTIVTQDMVNELMDLNRSMSYQDYEILDVAVQEYKVDSQLQLSPVGIQCSRLEGNFLNIVWRKMFYDNLNTCFDMAGVAIAEMFIAPLALADSVLTDAEKRSGCVLVDLGADTTTVSVYYKNILRHLAVIPLGGGNITKDIASLQIEDSVAEKMKLKYASACADATGADVPASYPIDSERNVESRKFAEIVEGRQLEIIENVWSHVPSEYADRLLGGIILTGGGSNMKNIDKAFSNYTNIEKIRTAKYVRLQVTSKIADATAHDGMMNTVLGLLAGGNMNCAGEETSETQDLFGINGGTRQPAAPHPGDSPTTPADRPAATPAQPQPKPVDKRLQAANEAATGEAGSEDTEKPAKEKKGGAKKVINRLKNFFKDMVTEE